MKFNLTNSINSPLPSSLKSECKKATKILNSFMNPGEGFDIIIPSSILEKAQGLAIFTVLKAGFLFSGRAGSGLVVARLPDGSWSAPSAIVTGGMGAGGQIGAELTDFVLVLNTKEAVKTFSHFGNITLGGNVSIAAGPIGRNAEASGSATFKHIAAIYSYSKTRGLFAGVSLEGSVIFTRNDANEKLYGERFTAKELLNGTVAPPHEADSLYRALNAKFHNLGNMGAMYQRRLDHEETRSVTRKATTISARGTLQIPNVRQITGGYGTPNLPPQPNQMIGYQTPQPPNNNYYNQSPLPQSPHNNYEQKQQEPRQLPPPPPDVYQQKPHEPQSPLPTSNTGGRLASAPPPLFEGQQISFIREIKSEIKSSAPPVPPPRVPGQHSKPTRAKALYPFQGQEDGDLTFQEGDVIIVTEKTESTEDWWTGTLNGKTGSFPANYVELMQ